MIGRLSGLRRTEARVRASELLDQFDLADAADRILKEYSGGMRRRLDLAAGLVTQTAGAVPRRADDRPRPHEQGADVGRDPSARRRRRDAAAHDAVPGRGRRARRPDRGDRPRPRDRRRHRGRAEERRSAGRAWSSRSARPHPAASVALAPFVAGPVHVSHDGRRLRAPVDSGAGLASTVVRALDEAGITVDDVEVHQPSLDDVFFALTGHPTDERRPCRARTIRTQIWRSPAHERRHIDSATPPARHAAVAPSQTTRSHGLAQRLRDVAVLTGRNLVHIKREPLQLSDVTVQPVLFTLLFVYVFGSGVVLPGGGSYKDFAIAGLLAMNLTTSAMGTAVGLSTDLGSGVIDRFRTLPMWRPAVLVGRSLADVADRRDLRRLRRARPAWSSAGGPTRARRRSPPASAIFLLFSYALSWGCACLGMVSKSPESAQGIGLVILFPLAIVSNALVPTERMPAVLQDDRQLEPRERGHHRLPSAASATPTPRRASTPGRCSTRSSPRCCGRSRWWRSSPPWPAPCTGAAPPTEQLARRFLGLRRHTLTAFARFLRLRQDPRLARWPACCRGSVAAGVTALWPAFCDGPVVSDSPGDVGGIQLVNHALRRC